MLLPEKAENHGSRRETNPAGEEGAGLLDRQLPSLRSAHCCAEAVRALGPCSTHPLSQAWTWAVGAHDSEQARQAGGSRCLAWGCG